MNKNILWLEKCNNTFNLTIKVKRIHARCDTFCMCFIWEWNAIRIFSFYFFSFLPRKTCPETQTLRPHHMWQTEWAKKVRLHKNDFKWNTHIVLHLFSFTFRVLDELCAALIHSFYQKLSIEVCRQIICHCDDNYKRKILHFNLKRGRQKKTHISLCIQNNLIFNQ